MQYKLRADSARVLLTYADSSLAPVIPQTPSISSTIPRLAALHPNTYGTANGVSRYNLDIERSGGLSPSQRIGNEYLDSRPMPLIYQNQPTFNSNSFTTTHKQPPRNLVRGISYPQPGPWTSRSPLISSGYQLRTQDPFIDLPSNSQNSAAPTRSRYHLLIVLLFIAVVFFTLGYLFLTESKTL